jgi:hypothetical protein
MRLPGSISQTVIVSPALKPLPENVTGDPTFTTDPPSTWRPFDADAPVVVLPEEDGAGEGDVPLDVGVVLVLVPAADPTVLLVAEFVVSPTV